MSVNAAFQSLPIARCVVWTGNYRRTVGDLAELAASIAAVGVLEPVLARPAGDGWEIIAGQRRFLGAELAGLDEIPALVRDVPDDVALELALVENAARADVAPLEEAAAIERLVSAHGRSVADVAARLGRSARWVERRRLLLNLTPESRAWCARLAVPLAHMEMLATVGTDTQSRVVARMGYVKESKDLPPFARFAQEITYELHLLASAPFEPDDAKLGGRGPCVGCVYRSDRQGDLFGTVPGGAHCLDRACWDVKVGGLWARTEKEAKRRKLTVLPLGEVSHGPDYGGELRVRPDVPYVTAAPTEGAKPVAVVRGQRGHVYELYAKPVPVETDEDEGADPDDEDGDTFAGRYRNTDDENIYEKRRAEREAAGIARLRKLYDLAGDPATVVSMLRMVLLSDLFEHGDIDAVRLARALGLEVQPGATETEVVRAIPDGDVLRVLLAVQVVGRIDAEPDELEPYEQTVLDLLNAPEQPAAQPAAPQRDPATAPAAALEPVRVWIAEAEWDALTLVDRADLEEPIGGTTVAWDGRVGFVTAEIADTAVLVALRGLAADIGVTLHEGGARPDREATQPAATGAELTLRVKRSVWQQHRSGLQDSAKGALHKAWQPEGQDRVVRVERGGAAHTKIAAYAREHGLDVRVDGGAT